MKIHQLPNGARFEYEGEEYVKTGPLFASGKAGQRLIPKYAVLRPLDAAPAAGRATYAPTFPRARVVAAIDAFHAACRALVPATEHVALDTAHAKCIAALAAPAATEAERASQGAEAPSRQG